MKKLFIVTLLFFFWIQSSEAQSKTVIVIEKRSEVGIEQMGLVLEKENVTLISNSNFLTSEFPLYLGHFELKVTRKIKKEILALTGKEIVKEEVYPSPHELTIYINGNQTPINAKKFVSALNLVKNIFKQRNLVLKNGIIIKTKEDLKNISCKLKEKGVCEFKYGYIHK